MRGLRSGVLLLAVCVWGCAAQVQERRENQGAVCALAAEGRSWQDAQTFAADAPVTVRYFVDACLSSSCDRDRRASCSVTVDGQDIRVDTHAEWTAQRDGECTDDCGLLTATCTTPPLAEGGYTLRSGEQEVRFTVPSEVERAPCTHDPAW